MAIALSSETAETAADREPLRDRKKRRTRDTIVASALRLFAEQGYDATSVEAIADAAEVSPATVFRYFRTKDDIIFSERHRAGERLAPAIAARPSAESDVTAVTAALREVFAQDDLTPERVSLLVAAAATSVVLRGRAAEVIAQWQQAIAEGLAHRHGTAVTDRLARMQAAFLMTALQFAVGEWLRNHQRAHFLDHLEDTFAAFADTVARWSRSEPPSM